MSVETKTIPTSEQGINVEFINRSSVPDPLEGVIEAPTRKERYDLFITEVIGKIWPRSSESGEYGDDFWRTTRANEGNLSGYTHFSPFARDPVNLLPYEFETMVKNLNTADYVRIRSVPPQLIDEGSVKIIPTGGSCVVETWGMRTATELRAESVSREGEVTNIELFNKLTEISRRIVEMAPTISHISGAMLSGQDHGVHYAESDMWEQRLESYGIPRDEATSLTQAAYERINEAVLRRARLINPKSNLIIVNFDDLKLSEAISDWLKSINREYDPSYRIIEVIQTYVGPKQIDLLKTALEARINYNHLSPKQKETAIEMIKAKYHVRGKQIDHGRWGSMDLPKEVIIGQRDLSPDEEQKTKTDYSYGMGITVMKNINELHKRNGANSIYVGFADIPSYGNSIAHQDREMGITISGKPGDEKYLNAVEASLNNPRRLHRENVDAHLEFLRNQLIDPTEKKSVLVAEKIRLNEELKPYTVERNKLVNEVKKLNDRIKEYETKKNIRAKTEALAKIEENKIRIQTIDSDFRFIVLKNQLEDIDKQVSQLSQNILPLSENPFVHHAMQFLWDSDFAVFLKESVGAQEQLTKLRGQINKTFSEEKEKMEQVKADERKKPKPDKERISCAEQDLGKLKRTLAEKEAPVKAATTEKVRELMRQLYPKLEAYILYLYGKIDYPTEIRNSRLLT